MNFCSWIATVTYFSDSMMKLDMADSHLCQSSGPRTPFRSEESRSNRCHSGKCRGRNNPFFFFFSFIFEYITRKETVF